MIELQYFFQKVLLISDRKESWKNAGGFISKTTKLLKIRSLYLVWFCLAFFRWFIRLLMATVLKREALLLTFPHANNYKVLLN